MNPRTTLRTISLVTLLVAFIALTAISNSHAFNAARAQAEAADAWGFVTHIAEQKANIPEIQWLLENGETGTCVSWQNAETGSDQRGTPQPPRPQTDGTMLREIEVFDANGRYVRVLWERTQTGFWIKKKGNIADRHYNLEYRIVDKLSDELGFWTWIKLPEKERKNLVKIVFESMEDPYNDTAVERMRAKLSRLGVNMANFNRNKALAQQ